MSKKEFYKLFKPQLTPKKMLELGVFGGTYFIDGSTKEFPKSWFTKAKIAKKFDIEINYFKIESGLSRKEWTSLQSNASAVRSLSTRSRSSSRMERYHR